MSEDTRRCGFCMKTPVDPILRGKRIYCKLCSANMKSMRTTCGMCSGSNEGGPTDKNGDHTGPIDHKPGCKVVEDEKRMNSALCPKSMGAFLARRFGEACRKEGIFAKKDQEERIAAADSYLDALQTFAPAWAEKLTCFSGVIPDRNHPVSHIEIVLRWFQSRRTEEVDPNKIMTERQWVTLVNALTKLKVKLTNEVKV